MRIEDAEQHGDAFAQRRGQRYQDEAGNGNGDREARAREPREARITPSRGELPSRGEFERGGG